MRKDTLGGALEFYSARRAGALVWPALVLWPTISKSREAMGLLQCFSWIRKAQGASWPSIRLLKVTLKQAQVLTMTLRGEDPGWEGSLFPQLCSFLTGDRGDWKQLEGKGDFRDVYSLLLFECPTKK